VYRGSELAGTIDRTAHGSSFRYASSFLRVHGREPRGIAYTLPCRAEPYDTVGVNLHSFFAGLLPEGPRLAALVRGAKTSPDDLLTLLMAAGSDTIGDVSLVAGDDSPKESIPTVDLSSRELPPFSELFERSIRYGSRDHAEIVVPGVQPKLSATSPASARRSAKSKRYILKLTLPDLPRMVENEHFFMGVAKKCGLDVPPTRLIRDCDGNVALLVERFDRAPAEKRKSAPIRIHQEDICQILDRYPADKYNLDYVDVAGALDLCSAPIVDLAKLVRLVAFAYLTGNGDLHGKNISLRTTPAGRVELTEAYDLLSTLPYGDRTMALGLDGRNDNLKRKTFVAFGERFGVRKAATTAILDQLCTSLGKSIPLVREIGFHKRETRYLERTMSKRLDDLAR
jgi:serine/threonine-protein kinase HipA